MWSINTNGTFAENKKTGATMKIALCADKLYRVKRKYKTIGTFTEMSDAKTFLADTVKKLNEE